MKVKDFRSAKQIVPMSEDLSKLFMSATFAESRGNTQELDEPFADLCGFAGKVLYRRLLVSSPSTKITNGVAAIVMMLVQGNPGKVVMWAYTFHNICKETGKKLITVSDLANYFPMGFPDQSSFEELWDAQKNPDPKIACDNLLDLQATWQ